MNGDTNTQSYVLFDLRWNFSSRDFYGETGDFRCVPFQFYNVECTATNSILSGLRSWIVDVWSWHFNTAPSSQDHSAIRVFSTLPSTRLPPSTGRIKCLDRNKENIIAESWPASRMTTRIFDSLPGEATSPSIQAITNSLSSFLPKSFLSIHIQYMNIWLFSF